MSFSLTATTHPASEDFFNIVEDDVRHTLDSFIKKHEADSAYPLEAVLENCQIAYRGNVESYRDYVTRFLTFTESMRFFEFDSFRTWPDKDDRVAVHFVKRAKECLEIARFFTMKSADLFESHNEFNWNTGYTPHFFFRCIYFGTASTWYANCFDHILQIAYWGLKLYDPTLDVQAQLKKCKYGYVLKKLSDSNNCAVHTELESCYNQIDEVRQWSNYTKHKGGLDYKYIEADDPFMLLLQNSDGVMEEIKAFESPIAVDIDDEIPKLAKAHEDLYNCLTNIVKAVDLDGKVIRFKNKEDKNHV